MNCAAKCVAQRCGNGVMESGEACDDANAYSGDGCSSACTLESGFICSNYRYPTGKRYTSCCRRLVNPITEDGTCSCAGIVSDSALYTVSDSCVLQDVNECMDLHRCAPNALCVNRDGVSLRGTADTRGYVCSCPLGFFGDGYLRCDTKSFAVTLTLAIQNLTQSGNRLSESWLADTIRNSSLVNLTLVRKIVVQYTTSSHSRRITLSAFDLVVVTMEVENWDVMQSLVDSVNADLIAAYLLAKTDGLNQISVLQSTTTLVQEAATDFTFSQQYTPGFVLSNISYAAVSQTHWTSLEHLWRFKAHFYTPLDDYHIVFITKQHAASSVPCVLSSDICCLHRMLTDYYLGDFGLWVQSSISPFCQGGFPNATALARTSQQFFTPLAQKRWYTGLCRTCSRLNVTMPTNFDLATFGDLQVDVSQYDVVTSIAAATVLPYETRYNFGIGMLFVRGLSTSNLHAVASQVSVDIVSSNQVTFITSSDQHYSFLEYIDMSLFEVQYRPTPGTLNRLQFVRATFMYNSLIKAVNDIVPSTSLQFFLSATPVSSGFQWRNPCYSSTTPVLRNGTGLWDSAVLQALYSTAVAQQCSLVQTSFCAVSAVTTDIYYIDIPLGDTAITSASQLYVRFVVEGNQSVGAVRNTEALSQVDAQIVAEDYTILKYCELPVASKLTLTDFTSVAVLVGIQLSPVDSDKRDMVLFTDVTNTVQYEQANALEISKTYTAASFLDSILTVAVEGLPTFFEQPDNLLAKVYYDHVITVHLRSQAKYDAMNALVQGKTAYTIETQASTGISSIRLDNSFVRVCNDGSLIPDPTPDFNTDCVIKTVVANRALDASRAHIVSDNSATDVAWLVDRMGSSKFMESALQSFSDGVRSTFALNYRYKSALWVIPIYQWPGANALQVVDRTILLVSFSVKYE